MSDIHINRGGQNLGIFTQTEVQTGLESGRFLGSDLAWRVGMENWKPLSQWAELTIPASAPLLTGAPILPGFGNAENLIPGTQDLPSWEQKNEIGVLKAFAATVKEVLIEPAATFARMKESGGFFQPFLYMLIATGIGVVLAVAVQFGMQGMMASFGGQPNELNQVLAAQGWSVAGGIGAFLGAALIFIPITMFVASFVGSGLWHLALMILGGANKSYEATYRVYCYTTGSTSLIGLVPCCGGVAAFIWKIVAGSIGLAKVHQISTGKAVLAILLPTLLCCGLCIAGLIPIYHMLLANPAFSEAFNKALNSR